MSTIQEVELCSELDELAEVERQMELWNMEAIELGRSMEALSAALQIDASRIRFRGDSIVFNSRRKSPQLAPALVDLARIRNVVLNLQLLHAQRKQLLVSPRSSP
jgi:hypothetical protein